MEVDFSGIQETNTEKLSGETVINVVGVGGAGGNVVRRMIEGGLNTVDYSVVNTDQKVLISNPAPLKIAIGRKLTKGLGAGMRPQIGRESAIENIDEIRNHLVGSHMVFIVAGMGGGTGTGAAPVIAEVAKELDILTIAVVSTPFDLEGKKRADLAKIGIEELKKHVDTLLVVPNERLMLIDSQLTMRKAFSLADDVLRGAITGISNLIIGESEINLDFMDIKTVMKDKGRAFIGVGVGKGNNRGKEAILSAMNSPILNNHSVQNASGVIVYLEVDSDFLLQDVNSTVQVIKEKANEDAHIIFGYKDNESFKNEVHVTVIVTGFGDDLDSDPVRNEPIKELFSEYEKEEEPETESEEVINLDENFLVKKVIDKPYSPQDSSSREDEQPAYTRKDQFSFYQKKDKDDDSSS